IATYGVQNLPALDDPTARDLIRRRMDQFVWKELAGEGPPANEPYFPFKEEEIPLLRQRAKGELREFLKVVRAAYCEKLVIKPPSTLTEIEPAQVSSKAPKIVVIRGENLPTEADVYFGNQKGDKVKCRPGRKEIEAVPPHGLAGSVEVRVVAPDGRDA